ncbi:MAG: histidine kinase [Chloroflexi bacterium]|nr:histidine kinase [Chloroflexota bacterium]
MRIARELHDETSQSLTALIVGLDLARMMLGTNAAKTAQALTNARSITKRMWEDIRRLVSDLRPTLLDDMGLVPAMAWYGEKRLKPAGIALHLEKQVLPDQLPSGMEMVLFRVVQEALTNVVRHARASIVHVPLVQCRGVSDVAGGRQWRRSRFVASLVRFGRQRIWIARHARARPDLGRRPGPQDGKESGNARFGASADAKGDAKPCSQTGFPKPILGAKPCRSTSQSA